MLHRQANVSTVVALDIPVKNVGLRLKMLKLRAVCDVEKITRSKVVKNRKIVQIAVTETEHPGILTRFQQIIAPTIQIVLAIFEH